MKKTNLTLLALLLFVCGSSRAQQMDSVSVAVDSAFVDSTMTVAANDIQNSDAIVSLYRKLYGLSKAAADGVVQKLNIVHIGDSHIQADLLTDKVRQNLQQLFGNGGRGFVFPHNLAHTNGASDVRFLSDQKWQSYRNVSAAAAHKVGISGIALYSPSDDFTVEFFAKEARNSFQTIKILTPGNSNSFAVAISKKTAVYETVVPKRIVHKIRRGEALSTIAEKYKLSVAQLKKFNNLKSNTIRAGKSLRIPTSGTQTQLVSRPEFIPLEIRSDTISHYYTTAESLDRIYILPNKAAADYVLSGLVLENDQPGILYHNIGVNGAKLSDYNKYALFFEQLNALSPDLIVIALGTNESFDHMETAAYMAQLELFLSNVRSRNPQSAILVITPPPSLFRRREPNRFVAGYARKISDMAVQYNYAVWDMFTQMGGLYNVNRNHRNGLMAADRIHYSKAGYELQGNLFSEALVQGYNSFKSNQQ